MSADQDFPNGTSDADSQPLDQATVSKLAESTAPDATPAFWEALDQRFDQVDTKSSSAGYVPAVTKSQSQMPSDIGSGTQTSLESVAKKSGRSSFLIAAAAVVVAAIGLVWVAPRLSSTASPAASNKVPIPSVLQAEEMTSTGGATQPIDGTVTVWRPGQITGEVTFPADGNYEFVVIANGTYPRFPGPALEVRLDFVTVDEPIYIEIDRFNEYRFVGFVSAGVHEVAVASPDLSDGPDSDSEFGSPGVIVDRIEIQLIEE